MSKKMLFLYSLTHFWVDLSCALLVFRTLAGGVDFALCLLLYNFCAFALQMPFGLLADRLDRNGVVSAAGCALTALAYFLPGTVPAAVAAGVGNALFHLGGGIDVLNRSGEQAWALGVFVSPGALGLFLGTLWGRGTAPGLLLAPAGLLLLGGAVLWLYRRIFGTLRSGNAPADLDAPGGYGVLLPLFLVVVLRSYLGMVMSFPWKKGSWAFGVVCALVLGKAAGGFLGDRLGMVRASALSLGLPAVLFLLSGSPWAGTAAVLLFNMTMPITLWAAARLLPPGLAFGTLTFALFLGFLPSWLGWPPLLTGRAGYAAGALCSMGLLVLGLKRGRL